MPEADSPSPTEPFRSIFKPDSMKESPGIPHSEAESPFRPSWIMETVDEFEKIDPRLQLRAKRLHKTPDLVATPDYLRKHYSEVEDLVLRGDVPEEDADLLMAKIAARIEHLETRKESSGGSQEPSGRPSPIEAAVADLTVQIGDLVGILRQSGELQPASGTQAEFATGPASQTSELREIFGRLDSEKEKARWVDVEYSQEFYTRFTPNMEPHFYTKIEETSERAEWDARWKLARAAFWKKIYSAFADKLAENQDLIELTKEQMEILYNLPGVKFALSWYARAIVAPTDAEKVEGRTILECTSGSDFEKFREKMRSQLRNHPDFDIQEQDEEKMGIGDRTRLISADAVAWNWIWCSNLIESIDSRYSIININEKRFGGRDRHGHLAPALCSDDLRAVFHPQEKFEDKCRNGQEWGNFGKWGLTQLRRIKGEHPGSDIVFGPARLRGEFWETRPSGKPHEIVVMAPECYPVTSMKSFWEAYDDEGKNGERPLLERLLDNQDINWASVDADPWKTNYLTVKMRKAIGLFEVFTKDSKEGWARALSDIYTRLNTLGILNNYYKSLGFPREKAECLARTHFHNIKVWAVYAVNGGVGRPQDRDVTDPYSRSALGAAHKWNRSTHESILRRPWIGYLEDRGLFNRESLVIESIQ